MASGGRQPARQAPAQDGTGPGWWRSDAELIAAVGTGRFSGGAPEPGSRMPAFARRLPARDIVAVVAFTKARWPVALRVMQAALNPGGRRPLGAAGNWRFPAQCKVR